MIDDAPTTTDARLTTGDPNLDHVLHGGIPPGSAVVVAGEPGTGKSILAHQIAFANATPEAPALLVSTMTESQSKVVRNLSAFDFFEADAYGDVMQSHSSADLLDGGIGALVDHLSREALRLRPSVIVVDSAKALGDAADPEELRRAMYDLVARVGHTGTTLLLVGEYVDAELRNRPEFAVADAILMIENATNGATDRRSIRVRKLRGSDFAAGRHSAVIDAGGFRVFPRLESIVRAAPTDPSTERISFGVERLDEYLGGGLPTGDSTLILGPSGAGKTVLSLHFVGAGLAAGERALYVTLEEGPDALRAKARAFGIPIDEAIEDGRLQLLHAPITELDIDRLADEIRGQLREFRPRRVVFDSLGELATGAKREQRHPGFLWSLSNLARGSGASTIFTQESAAFGSGATEALSHLFHNVLVLRYVEAEDRLGRALTIMKMRDSDHSRALIDFDVTGQGVVVRGELTNTTGMSGWGTLSHAG